jgi:hypothetical protein
MIEWFSANGLALNMEKTNIMKFTPSNRLNTEFEIMHHDKLLCGNTQMPRIASVEMAPFLPQYIQQATPINSAN